MREENIARGNTGCVRVDGARPADRSVEIIYNEVKEVRREYIAR